MDKVKTMKNKNIGYNLRVGAKEGNPEFEYQHVLLCAINTYGKDQQVGMFHEEIGELMQAVNKYKRKPDLGNLRNLAEEIADAEIMIGQLKIMHEIERDVTRQKYIKLSRLKSRLLIHLTNGIKTP